MDEYLLDKPILCTTNPLTWWKEKQHRLPQLAKVARCLHNAPATSITSVRVFSAAGLTVTKLCIFLKSSYVDALVFCTLTPRISPT